MPKNKYVLSASEIAATPEFEFHHPLHEKTVVFLRALGQETGLQHVGVSVVRVPPKGESFPYHCHHGEEEFVYVLSGRAVLEVGEDTFEIGAGDFLGFPRGPVAHQLRNPYDTDLVYLTGGERHELEVADFPKLKKRMVRVGGEANVVDMDQLQLIWRFDED